MKKYYSARGDDGQTDQLGKGRISKSHLRIRAVGALDEASAALGLARAQAANEGITELVKTLQRDLYQIMSLAALEKPNPDKFPDLNAERISWLEAKIDHYGKDLETPSGFILPGENLPSAAFGLARTVVRRAERQTVALNEAGLLFSANTLPYLNRLSSLCFTLELLAAQKPFPQQGGGS
jgi:cob(I)alamin adenosyltransferase